MAEVWQMVWIIANALIMGLAVGTAIMFVVLWATNMWLQNSLAADDRYTQTGQRHD